MKKKKIPDVIILYVNPLRIFNNICPEIILAPNLNPKETLRARYEINSISTKRGNNANGQPAGTNNEKKCSPCFWKPSIVAPKTIVKLKEKVKIK